MAEDVDHESKTEAPTERRVREALDKGDIPFSREAPVFASILGLLIGLSLFARGQAAQLARDLAPFLDHPRGFALASAGDVLLLLQAVAGATARFLLPFLLLLAACGLSASILQNVPRLVGERILPKWRNVSPASGFSRIFGRSGQVEFLKSVLKVLGVSLVVVLLLRSERQKAVNAMFVDPSQLPELILTISIRLVSAVSIATIVIVAGDLVWARLRWQRSLRMSVQDVKDEHKQSEGDPTVKARLRSLAQDRSRNRMLAAVPRATVVIANPTHFAVALRYEPSENPAPLVVAKGQDLIALRIRAIAEENGIAVIEDKPLARSLYDAVQVDQTIPAEFYRAVAQILFFLFARPR
ncbi:flagellar biosynthesis protein FlhB [Methylobacterium gregans]|uniref:Flagellar biosynthetic protein FlhB n=1 Tax=Methylobacterium gregans TaxID=374424 RepID=A0AA37MEG3_9HYPH|nr:flagellar biosynthesis protein FlhB [Methylobacterium gregans]MDQ0521046.1 flagellar biosynthetic protein FlhB [Methylobacterium gregans]GJD80654.1 Flagellar biosynthetic protein FlhB [Methylobacterium gregans]GLS54213.1 flagellar biosynthesis protein FlhB [Methylobacterium gregans]